MPSNRKTFKAETTATKVQRSLIKKNMDLHKRKRYYLYRSKGTFPINPDCSRMYDTTRFCKLPFPTSFPCCLHVFFFFVSTIKYTTRESNHILHTGDDDPHSIPTFRWCLLFVKKKKKKKDSWATTLLSSLTLTSSKRRCTEMYFPLLFALRSLIRATKPSPSVNIGLENFKAS